MYLSEAIHQIISLKVYLLGDFTLSIAHFNNYLTTPSRKLR